MYTPRQLEDALCQLWELVEDRLTEDDLKALGCDDGPNITTIFQELHEHGTNGPVGLGLGRMGGHSL